MLKRFLLLFPFGLLCGLPAQAQLPSIELHSIHPPVIPAGATTEVSLRGSHLEELTGLHFSDPAIRAEPVLLPANEFRTAPGQDGSRFRVTVPAGHERGLVEVRVAGLFGISPSRLLFIAGDKEKILSDSAGGAHHTISGAPGIAREARAYGNIDANEVDWWKFDMKKGERILAHCFAERIDSGADASLKLVDSTGRELETSRDAIGRDPMIDFTAPADGSYWIGVHDFLYLGGENFPYLLQLSQRPWIDAVFPPVGQQGQSFEATLLGRLLPGSQSSETFAIDGKPLESLRVKIEVPPTPDISAAGWEKPSRARLPTFPYSFKNSPPVPIGISALPVTMVEESGETPTFTPPREIVAKMDQNGDTDSFRFSAKKGTTYFVEIVGNRIHEHFDPYLVIEKITRDEAGKESFSRIRESDDENGSGGATFPDRSMDPILNFVADQDGEYQINVINQFASGAGDMIYRVAIRQAEPDFAVIAVAERDDLEQRQAYPSAPLLRQGGTYPMRLLLYRKDGFSGPITIAAKGLPPGVTCPPVTARDKESSVYLVFSATPEAPPWSGTIALVATGNQGEKKISHPVRSGTLVNGADDYNVSRVRSRLETAIPLAISPSEKAPVRIEVAKENQFKVMMGEKLEIPVRIAARNSVKGNLIVTPSGLRGLTRPPNMTITDKDEEGKLTLNFTKQNNVFTPEAGTWNFVLKATGVTPYEKNLKAVEKVREEQKTIDALAKQYAGKADQAKAAEETARKNFEKAQQGLNTASPEAKPALEKAVAEARKKHEAAQIATKEAEARRAEAEKEKAAAAQRVSAAGKEAAKKDLKFAAWSLPLTVEITEAPKKPEEK